MRKAKQSFNAISFKAKVVFVFYIMLAAAVPSAHGAGKVWISNGLEGCTALQELQFIGMDYSVL